MKRACLLVLLTLSACTDPQVDLGIAVGSEGVAVYPAVIGNVGGVDVGISGYFE